MKLQMIDTEVVAATPRPLRFKVRHRPTQPSGNWVIDSRRVMGLTMLRIAFGVIWAVNASLKWQPAFQANFQQILSGVAKGQPGFLNWWFGLWQFVVSGRAPIFGLMTASTETYLAVALLTGFARRFTYSVGILYGLFVWSVAEGFGGPYMPGSTTDVGAAIIYSFVFGALLLVDAGRFSVDHLIEKRIPAWRWISDFRG
jgi:nitrite reductase (NO-forming)